MTIFCSVVVRTRPRAVPLGEVGDHVQRVAVDAGRRLGAKPT